MFDPRSGDHALGVELQIEELFERRERARRQGSAEEADALTRQIAALHEELANQPSPMGSQPADRPGPT